MAAVPQEDGKSADFEIGDRIVDAEGFCGTVRYVGPVATSKKQETIYAGKAS